MGGLFSQSISANTARIPLRVQRSCQISRHQRTLSAGAHATSSASALRTVRHALRTWRITHRSRPAGVALLARSSTFSARHLPHVPHEPRRAFSAADSHGTCRWHEGTCQKQRSQTGLAPFAPRHSHECSDRKAGFHLQGLTRRFFLLLVCTCCAGRTRAEDRAAHLFAAADRVPFAGAALPRLVLRGFKCQCRLHVKARGRLSERTLGRSTVRDPTPYPRSPPSNIGTGRPLGQMPGQPKTFVRYTCAVPSFIVNVLASMVATLLVIGGAGLVSQRLRRLFTALTTSWLGVDIEYVFRNEDDARKDLYEELRRAVTS